MAIAHILHRKKSFYDLQVQIYEFPKITLFAHVKNHFSRFSRKVSVLDDTLLHSTYINVAITHMHILVYRKVSTIFRSKVDIFAITLKKGVVTGHRDFSPSTWTSKLFWDVVGT